MTGLNPMNANFRDSTAFQYPADDTDTRSDFSESIGAGTRALVDRPVDTRTKHALGDPSPNAQAEGGATYDPGSQMTAQARYGSRREADREEAKKLPRVRGPVGDKSAVEDIKDEVGFIEGQLGTVAAQTRGH